MEHHICCLPAKSDTPTHLLRELLRSPSPFPVETLLHIPITRKGEDIKAKELKIRPPWLYLKGLHTTIRGIHFLLKYDYGRKGTWHSPYILVSVPYILTLRYFTPQKPIYFRGPIHPFNKNWARGPACMDWNPVDGSEIRSLHQLGNWIVDIYQYLPQALAILAASTIQTVVGCWGFLNHQQQSQRVSRGDYLKGGIRPKGEAGCNLNQPSSFRVAILLSGRVFQRFFWGG